MNKKDFSKLTTSQGVQKKYRLGYKFIKIDSSMSEGIREVLCSIVLDSMNLPHIRYSLYKDDSGHRGCSCDYINKEQISYYRLEQLGKGYYYERDVNSFVAGAEMWGDDISKQLRLLFYVDVLLSNPDRHLNNIVFFVEGTKYKMFPLFDFGNALTVTTLYKPLFLTEETLLKQIDIKKMPIDYSYLYEGVVELYETCESFGYYKDEVKVCYAFLRDRLMTFQKRNLVTPVTTKKLPSLT